VEVRSDSDVLIDRQTLVWGGGRKTNRSVMNLVKDTRDTSLSIYVCRNISFLHDKLLYIFRYPIKNAMKRIKSIPLYLTL